MFLSCFMLAFLSEYGLVDSPTTRITAIFCHRVICVLMQKLWQLKVPWDEPLNDDLLAE